jgi:spoIIIJ-associated protein
LRQVDIQALSVEEAVRLALEQLGCTRDQVKVEVLATDPGGEEVLVRVIAPDRPGSSEEVSPRGKRTLADAERRPDRAYRPQPPRDRERQDRPDRPDRPERFDRGERPDRDRSERYGGGDGNRYNRQGPPRYRDREAPPRVEDDVPGEVLLDESLQATDEAMGEHATPQDAIAPVAAEILQHVLVGMKLRGTIVRREQHEEGEAAFADDSDSVVLNVVGLNERDQNILIGRRGETLDAVQFLVNLMLGRKVDLWARVVVDVEGYRLRRKLALINLARRTADQVQTRQQAIPLEAMPAHERRIIHMTLSEHPEVTTESSGAEPERRVVVLPR